MARFGLIGLALLVVVAGCTSSADDTTTTSTPTVTSDPTMAPSTTSSTSTMPPTTSTTTGSTVVASPSTTTTKATNPSPPTTSGESAPADNGAPSVAITSPGHLSSHQAEFIESEGRFGAYVALSADLSDPDGDPVTLEWFSSDQGFLGTGESLTALLLVPRGDTAQPYITARATDRWGATSETQIQIIVWVPSDS